MLSEGESHLVFPKFMISSQKRDIKGPPRSETQIWQQTDGCKGKKLLVKRGLSVRSEEAAGIGKQRMVI